MIKIVFSLVLISNLHFILPLPVTTGQRTEEKEPPLASVLQNNAVTEDGKPQVNSNTVKSRVKRAKGTDKFSKAADMTETKMFQMYLQLFKNLWVSSYVGGGHPLHPDVPKPVMLLYKQKILSFFFPPIGEDAKKL